MFFSQQRPSATHGSLRISKRDGEYGTFCFIRRTSRISSRIFPNAGPFQCSAKLFPSWMLPRGFTVGSRSRQQGRMSPFPVIVAVYQGKKHPPFSSLNDGAVVYML